MARIIYTAVVESIRGSIAGTTFQKNKHGYTIKKKPNMVHPNTALQSSRKSILSQASRAWRDLTQNQRDLYDTFASSFPQYAKHNPASQLGGFSDFVRYNCLNLLIGEVIDTDINQSVPDTDSLTYTVRNDSGVLSIGIVSTTGDEDWEILFFLSRSRGASQKFIGTSPKYVKHLSNATQSLTITDEYSAIFGAVPAVGEFVAMDALLIADNSPYVLARDSQIYTVGTTP